MNRYRPGVHEACLTQLLRVVWRDLVAQNAANGADLPSIAAALALNPNQYFTMLPLMALKTTIVKFVCIRMDNY